MNRTQRALATMLLIVTAGPAHAQIATKKKPTKFFEDVIGKGRTAMVAVDFTPLQGGVPIVVDGQVVGGIGVSGASSAQQDEELAIAGATALTGVSN